MHKKWVKVSRFENLRGQPETATHVDCRNMVSVFEQYVFNVHQGSEKIIPVISFSNLSKLNENLLEWLATKFNQALRKSKKLDLPDLFSGTQRKQIVLMVFLTDLVSHM